MLCQESVNLLSALSIRFPRCLRLFPWSKIRWISLGSLFSCMLLTGSCLDFSITLRFDVGLPLNKVNALGDVYLTPQHYVLEKTIKGAKCLSCVT